MFEDLDGEAGLDDLGDLLLVQRAEHLAEIVVSCGNGVHRLFHLLPVRRCLRRLHLRLDVRLQLGGFDLAFVASRRNGILVVPGTNRPVIQHRLLLAERPVRSPTRVGLGVLVEPTHGRLVQPRGLRSLLLFALLLPPTKLGVLVDQHPELLIQLLQLVRIRVSRHPSSLFRLPLQLLEAGLGSVGLVDQSHLGHFLFFDDPCRFDGTLELLLSPLDDQQGGL